MLPDAGWERTKSWLLERLLREGDRRAIMTSMCTWVNFLGRFLVKKPALRFKFR